MNENYNQIFDEGKSVSIAGLCAYVLKKWKLMVIVALIAAIAAGGMSYISSKQAYEVEKNSTGMPTEPAISEYDKDVVRTKINMMETCEETIQEYRNYYDKSIKVKLDPNNVYQGTINYTLSGTDESEVLEAVTLCESLMRDDASYQSLEGKLAKSYEPEMIREVAWFTSAIMGESGDVTGDGSFMDARLRFYVRHYEEAECQVMMKHFEACFEEAAKTIQTVYPEVKLTKISTEFISTVDRSLAPLSKDVRNGELTTYETISNLKKNMSEEQAAYYEYLEKMEDIEANGLPEVQVAEPTVDILMIVIAAVAGAVCVAAVYAVLYLFGGRVHNVDELKSWISAPVIEAEAGAEMVAAILEGIAVKSDKKKIYLTGSMAESNVEFIKQLKNVLATKGMEAMSGGSLLKDAKAFEEAASCGAVMLLEKCNVSKEKDLKETIVKAASCGIQVLGIVLEK